MRLSRMDFVPLTAIIAGGAIGASLTFGALVSWSPADDVPAPVQSLSVRPVSVRPLQVRSPDGRLYTFRSVDVASFELTAIEEQLSKLKESQSAWRRT